MREIKFRFWDKVNKQMIYSDYAIVDKNLFLVKFGNKSKFYCHPETHSFFTWFIRSDYEYLMQFTGLLDKNDVKIYEGDIITYNMIGWDEKINEKYNNQFKGIIVYNWDKFQIKYSDTKLSKCYHYLNKAQKMKIIGNIYENPELIK